MNAAMPEDRLTAIEARANAATPGPWWNDSHEIYVGVHDGSIGHWIGETCNIIDSMASEANAAFMAAARRDVPDLLAEVRRLQARVAELEQASPVETALCNCWIKEHGSPARWSESVRRAYANLIADLRADVAR